MCGIVGYSGVDPYNIEDLRMLMVFNALKRGEDSTGIYTPLNGLKKTVDSAPVFVNKYFNKMKKDNLFIGHVRSSTVGDVSDDNAHPFNRGSCMLVHNGTLKNYYALQRKYKLGYDKGYEVDSDILAGCIAAAENFSPLSEIDGAAAILVVDTRNTNNLYVFKNKERPLYCGYKGRGMYISSLKEALEFISCGDIASFKDDKLYTIVKGDIVAKKKIVNKPYVEPPVVLHPANQRINDASVDMMRYASAAYNNAVEARALGCLVRARNNNLYTNGKTHIMLSQHKYYKIVELINHSVVKILDYDTGATVDVPKISLVVDDIIFAADFICAIRDIHYVGTDEVCMPKGMIIQCNHSGVDGIVSVKLLDGSFVHVDKDLFRKLTPVETRWFIDHGRKGDTISNLEDRMIDLDTEARIDSYRNDRTAEQSAASFVEYMKKQEERDILLLTASKDIVVRDADDVAPWDESGNIQDIDELELEEEDLEEEYESKIALSIWELEDELIDYFNPMYDELIEIKRRCLDANIESETINKIDSLIVKNHKLCTLIFPHATE